MAPHAIYETHNDDSYGSVDIKAKVVASQVELDLTPAPPVADDFMYDFKFNHALPTSDVLGIEVPADCDAQKEAEAIVAQLSRVLGDGDAQAFTSMFLEYGEWLLRKVLDMANT
jgi:hypothetical protein